MNTRFAKFLAVFFALLIIVALAAPTLWGMQLNMTSIPSAIGSGTNSPSSSSSGNTDAYGLPAKDRDESCLSSTPG